MAARPGSAQELTRSGSPLRSPTGAALPSVAVWTGPSADPTWRVGWVRGLLSAFLDAGWLQRRTSDRALVMTARGGEALQSAGLNVD